MADPLSTVATAAETVALRVLRPDHRSTTQLASITSRVSSGGALWTALTTAGALSSRTRHAGIAGLAAWTVASSAAFAGKQVARRARPSFVAGIGPGPRTSSMPSSHTAGAVAYATAASLAAPATALVTVPAALAVSWSRAATGRHFPTDVAAGTALGLAAGAAVHAVHRRWRRRSSLPAADVG